MPKMHSNPDSYRLIGLFIVAAMLFAMMAKTTIPSKGDATLAAKELVIKPPGEIANPFRVENDAVVLYYKEYTSDLAPLQVNLEKAVGTKKTEDKVALIEKGDTEIAGISVEKLTSSLSNTFGQLAAGETDSIHEPWLPRGTRQS